MLRLLAVTAHPDDEAAVFGGTLRLYSDRGIEISVICLTAGQAARHRGAARNDQELGELRRKEFAASCQILGVHHGVVLDYPDGQLHRIDLQRPVAELVARVREFRPHVMLSMGPEGAITGHTDHSMASLFATLAFHWAGRENRFAQQLSDSHRPHCAEKLYYSTDAASLPNRPPISLPPVTATLEIGSQLKAKRDAFYAHKSQAPLFPLFDEHVKKLGNLELFNLAAGVKAGPVPIESDLFAGIVEE
jgi:LmbE family N-acetylglucosaminyl deacetylase